MVSIAPIEYKPETLGDVVYARIYEAIVTRALQPGERVTEAGLARQLRVSKTPAREALLRLREVGLIEPDGARGSRVLRASAVALREAYEIREALEPHTARLLAERVSPAGLRTIRAHAERTLACARTGDTGAFRGCDAEFHREIANLAGNTRIAAAIDNAMALIRALQQRDLPSAQACATAAEGHLRVVEALEHGDGIRAAEEISEHIRWVKAQMLDTSSGTLRLGDGARDQ